MTAAALCQGEIYPTSFETGTPAIEKRLHAVFFPSAKTESPYTIKWKEPLKRAVASAGVDLHDGVYEAPPSHFATNIGSLGTAADVQLDTGTVPGRLEQYIKDINVWNFFKLTLSGGLSGFQDLFYSFLTDLALSSVPFGNIVYSAAKAVQHFVDFIRGLIARSQQQEYFRRLSTSQIVQRETAAYAPGLLWTPIQRGMTALHAERNSTNAAMFGAYTVQAALTSIDFGIITGAAGAAGRFLAKIAALYYAWRNTHQVKQFLQGNPLPECTTWATAINKCPVISCYLLEALVRPLPIYATTWEGLMGANRQEELKEAAKSLVGSATMFRNEAAYELTFEPPSGSTTASDLKKLESLNADLPKWLHYSADASSMTLYQLGQSIRRPVPAAVPAAPAA